MTINIAVAGHVNAGKTTLISTLTRQEIGEIGNSANVTKESKTHFYEGLQANFTDTPGFQYPSIALDYLDNETLSQRNQENITYDIKAMNSIKTSDVVIYLVNLSTAIEDSHKYEIEVVKRVNPKVVAVLNQYHSNVRASSRSQVRNIRDGWTKEFKQKGINDVITFDAHWDRRSKEEEIYDAILSILDNDKLKSDFQTGLNQFKNRQLEIRNEVYSLLAKSIQELQEFLIKVKKGEYDTQNNSSSDNNQKIKREIHKEMLHFLDYIEKLYKVSAERPTDTAQNLIIEAKKRVNVSGRIAAGAATSALFGSIGGLLGGVLTGIVMVVIGGGTAIIPTAMIGAQFFGVVTAAIGATNVFNDTEDHMEISLTSEDIQNYFELLFAIIWGLEHKGYGKNKELSEEEGRNIMINVKELTQNLSLDWTRINNNEIIDYCHKIFADLEKKEKFLD